MNTPWERQKKYKASLELCWVTDEFKMYDYHLKTEPSICMNSSLFKYDCNYCLNFSYLRQKTHRSKYYIFFRSYNIKFSLLDNTKLKSWNEASLMCQSVGGYLPITRSREEPNELIALIKLSPF